MQRPPKASAALASRRRPLVGRAARQSVGGVEPRDPALGPDVQAGPDRRRIVEGGDADIDQLRVVIRLPAQGRSAAPAEPPPSRGRGAVRGRAAGGHDKDVRRHAEPGDDRRAVRAAADSAMAIEHLDRGGLDAVADVAAEAAAGQRLVHRAPLPLIFRLTGNPRRSDVRPASAAMESHPMTIDVLAIQPLIALLAGILILLVPRVLNYVIAIYLILIGLIGLWPHLLYHIPH